MGQDVTTVKYKIESRRLGGWEDADWANDDKPLRFNSPEEAQKEIDEFIKLSISFFGTGKHEPENYRVVVSHQ